MAQIAQMAQMAQMAQVKNHREGRSEKIVAEMPKGDKGTIAGKRG